MKIQVEASLVEKEGFYEVVFKLTPNQLAGIVTQLKEKKKTTPRPAPTPGEALKVKQKRLFDAIKKYAEDNPGKYPRGLLNAFYVHWREPTKNGTSTRYDDEKYFEMGKRLGTFISNAGPDKMKQYWKEHQEHNANGERKEEGLFKKE